MKVPSIQTLKKYGLSREDWVEMYNLQGGVCPICKHPIENPVVDHFHVRNWKKMRPDKRKLYVRGLLCSYCNHRLLMRGMSLDRARNIVDYLEAFDDKLKDIK